MTGICAKRKRQTGTMLCAKMVHADSFISRSSMLLLTFFLGLMLGYSTMLFLKSAKIQDSGYIIHAWASACSVAKFVRYRTPKEANPRREESPSTGTVDFSYDTVGSGTHSVVLLHGLFGSPIHLTLGINWNCLLGRRCERPGSFARKSTITWNSVKCWKYLPWMIVAFASNEVDTWSNRRQSEMTVWMPIVWELAITPTPDGLAKENERRQAMLHRGSENRP
jgi:hypothetical protein